MITIPKIFQKEEVKEEQKKSYIDMAHPLRPFLEIEGLTPEPETKALLDFLFHGALTVSCNFSRDEFDAVRLRRYIKKCSKRLKRNTAAYNMCRDCLKHKSNHSMATEFSTRFMYFLGFAPYYRAPVNQEAIYNCQRNVRKEFGNVNS